MSEVLSVGLPLDEDGFLRRECPECKHEFKVEVAHDEEKACSLEKLFCPYCGISATLEHWYTKAQEEYIQNKIAAEVVDPQLDKLIESFRKLERQGGLIKIKVETKRSPRREPRIGPEPNDMRPVKFTCCDETIKILEDWEDQIHCVICGNTDFAERL
jgi:hypothetical protein